MKKILIAILVLVIVFNLVVNINVLLNCDGSVVQGVLRYECIPN